ncbi:hypothetical protein WJX84_000917 [Apatococcus fuscideae]|uniref:Uncharacterized protein n=1 Tax=Apatococcus fuscideae TaxID=2026836 RepID=A0AAW1TBJ9_9CHLO
MSLTCSGEFWRPCRKLRDLEAIVLTDLRQRNDHRDPWDGSDKADRSGWLTPTLVNPSLIFLQHLGTLLAIVSKKPGVFSFCVAQGVSHTAGLNKRLWQKATLAWARTTVDASPDKVYAKIADMSEWQSWLDKDYKAKSHTKGLLSSGDGFHYTVGPNRVNATVIQANPHEEFVWSDNTLMGLIQSQHKYTLRKVGGGLFKPSQTEITVKQELSGPLKWVIKGKDLEKQMSLRLTSLQQAVSTPQ